jgi:hypothetical protein
VGLVDAHGWLVGFFDAGHDLSLRPGVDIPSAMAASHAVPQKTLAVWYSSSMTGSRIVFFASTTAIGRSPCSGATSAPERPLLAHSSVDNLAPSSGDRVLTVPRRLGPAVGAQARQNQIAYRSRFRPRPHF